MKRITVTITGVTPMLMHRFGESAEVAVQNGSRPVHEGEKDSPRNVAEKFAYRGADGTLVLPGPNFFAALVSAGKFHKLGKNKMTTNSSSLVPAIVMVETVAASLGTKIFEVDSRRIVNPTTRGARLCHRPILYKWSATFTLAINTELADEKIVRKLVDDAGNLIGVGAFRPEKRGPFGRFVVTKWVES